jgi:serine/threonine protein kinase/formylglycine-generating enzyme required for sulfatase activity
MPPTPSDDPDTDGTHYHAGPRDPKAPEPDATHYGQQAGEVDSTRYGAARGTMPGTSAAQPRIRRVGEYELLQELGRGGMGVVYKARDLRLNRFVALKMIRSGIAASEQDVQRFLGEAKAAARLDHPHIVPIFEISESDGVPYFVMALVEGGSLQERLTEGPLPAKQAAALLRAVAEAVQHAHEHGVVHRDLKPHNILLHRDDGQAAATAPTAAAVPSSGPPGSNPRGSGNPASGVRAVGIPVPKVTDFGIARIAGQDGLTATGEILGTPSYMPPEQASGRMREAGPLADVYSLGAVLYSMLTGRPPFQAATPLETLAQVQNQEPVPPRRLNSTVPRDLQTICLKCLQKNPSRRYDSAAELVGDLGRFLHGEPILARPAGRLERAGKWIKRRPVLAAMWGLVLLLTAAGVVGITWAYGEAVRERDVARNANRDRILAQGEQLGTAAPQAVQSILDALAQDSSVLAPMLRQKFDDEKLPRQRRMRAGLALVATEPERVCDALVEWLLDAEDPAEVVLTRDVLAPQGEALRDRFWAKAAEAREPVVRFRAMVALAALDPAGDGWLEYAATVAEQMLAANPLHVGTWMKALRPVRDHLLEPLGEVFRTTESADRREVAAMVLADYAADRPDVLAELLLDADNRQFAVLFPVLRQHARAAALLLAGLERQPPAEATEAQRGALAREHATAGMALLRLGQEDPFWPLLRHSPDPTVRSYLVRDLARRGIEARQLVRRLAEKPKPSEQRALILALGEYEAEQLPPDLRRPLIETLLRRYRDEPDAGIHGAIDWLLGHAMEGPEQRKFDWDQGAHLRQIDEQLKRRDPDGSRLWYVNGQGQTMVVVQDPLVFRMGSPPGQEKRKDAELETLHQRRIGHSFAIASKPVTVEQFQRFLRDRPDVPREFRDEYSPEPDGPILDVLWFVAAQYCNWLSEKEQLPPSEWCYPPHAQIKEGMKPYPDSLKRRGYRLPTEAEWEYAARAGATSSRYYGSSIELLPRYAWYIHNAQDRTWPVGQKRPNDLGLFDMHGNVWNWCQESTWKYDATAGEEVAEDKEDTREVKMDLPRTLRGGAFNTQPRVVRVAYRLPNRPGYRFSAVGFRPARTVP